MKTFPAVELTDELLTGVVAIDRQHCRLINILNEANEKLAENRTGEVIDRITRDLLAYALFHFETEEGLMRELGYDVLRPDEAQAHLREHRHFSGQVVLMRDTLRSGKALADESLIAFLNDWLAHHILTTDKLLGQFITSENRSPALAESWTQNSNRPI